jgi:type VI secretion system secreted protein Hcp
MAFDAFLKIDGIPGESTDDKHKNEIDVISFSFGASRSGKGRVAVADFSVVKLVDKASPLLFDAACQGEVAENAYFVARKAGAKPLDYIKITFEDVIITGVQHTGSAGTDDLPLESVSLGFSRMEMEVTGGKGETTKTVCSPSKPGPGPRN